MQGHAHNLAEGDEGHLVTDDAAGPCVNPPPILGYGPQCVNPPGMPDFRS